MKINNFTKFNENKLEKIFEQIINESIIYYSPRLRNIFKKFKNNDIANALLDAEKSDNKNDITFIDYDEDKEGYFTFTKMSKVMKNLNNLSDNYLKNTLSKIDKEANITYSDYIFNHNLSNIPKLDRNPIKITRIINKLVSDKFTPADIDVFSRKFIAKISNKHEFRIVEGDDIAYWYNMDRYSETSGDLGNSCMRSVPAYFFEIYTSNPDVCRMIIMLDDEEKLLGRALLWKISKHSVEGNTNKKIKSDDDLYYMDRQYTINSTLTEYFREYARKNGWSYKTYNNAGNTKNVTYNDTTYSVSMEIDITESYSHYPYMDTFKRFDPNDYTLYNDDNEDHEDHYILEDTGGGYREIESGHWSDYEDRRIPEEYSIWSDVVSSYLHIDNAVEVTSGSRGNRGWYPDGYNEIVYDEWRDEYIHTNDAVYSEWYSYYILLDDSIESIVSIDSDGEPSRTSYVHNDDSDFTEYSSFSRAPWFIKLENDYRRWNDYQYIYKGLLFMNYKQDYSIEEFKIKVYRIIELSDDSIKIGFKIGDVLAKVDASILKCKVDDIPLNTDAFDYHKDIEDYTQEYYNFLVNKIKELEYKISGKQTLIDFKDNNEYIKNIKNMIVRIDERIDELKNNTYNNDIIIEDNE
jgi:hypothetical protein